MSYNSTVHTAHNRTPHEVMFGWKMHCVYETPDETPNKDQDNEMSVYEISDNDQDNEMSVYEAHDNDYDNETPDNNKDDEMSEESNRDASETFTPNNVIEQHVLQVSKIHEARTMVNIAPDHDTNPQTRKRKLQPTFSQQGTFIRLTSNNHTAIVEIDGKETPVPIKRIKVVKS
ncbi:1019_t:CDS:2 [Ambispora leptoticha]|uniref:1019_t:CDS:1 n=1 Tax=Ambispora leptoticha TaxID=144679 RepID=A0A9N9DWW9_9GLOM|nr:1019_t:CDS:2 [Ambispora leptoticha]